MQDYKFISIVRTSWDRQIVLLRIADQYRKHFQILSVDHLKYYFKTIGSFWFSPDSMAFFNSRINLFNPGSDYFITSEKSPNNRRLYSIRKIDYEEGRIETIGQFQQYSSLSSAKRDLMKLRESE